MSAKLGWEGTYHRQAGYFTTTNGVVLQPHGTPGDTVGPWQRPAFATFGDIRRNSLYGPGFWQTDMDVKKSFRFSNDAAFEIRIWISNVFNKVNLNNPVTCVDCLDGGKILGARSRGSNERRRRRSA